MGTLRDNAVNFHTEDKPDTGLVLRRYCGFSDLSDILNNRKIKFWNTSRWDDKNDKYLMEKYKTSQNWQQIYAFCSTKTRKEHYHHWLRYAGKKSTKDDKFGVCIVFDRAAIKKFAEEKEFQCGYIRYKTLDQLKNDPIPRVHRLPFLKRVAFSDEREFRIFRGDNKLDEEYITLDISLDWIKKIRISPWLTKEEASHSASRLKGIADCGELDILHSTLLQSQQWRKYADQVATNKYDF